MRLARLLSQPLALRRSRARELHLKAFGCSLCLLGPTNRRYMFSNGASLSTLALPSSYLSLVGKLCEKPPTCHACRFYTLWYVGVNQPSCGRWSAAG
jgi:hypothetical protein